VIELGGGQLRQHIAGLHVIADVDVAEPTPLTSVALGGGDAIKYSAEIPFRPACSPICRTPRATLTAVLQAIAPLVGRRAEDR
jgi:hypothetical protein